MSFHDFYLPALIVSEESGAEFKPEDAPATTKTWWLASRNTEFATYLYLGTDGVIRDEEGTVAGEELVAYVEETETANYSHDDDPEDITERDEDITEINPRRPV